MGFGGIMSVAVLICAACVFHPRHTSPQSFDQMAQTLSAPLGQAGRYLFGAALFIACFGASLEVSLDAAYITGQGFGWNWGANKTPQEAPRFALVYTLLFPLAAIFTFIGVDPMKLTIFSMAVTTLILPLVILPFLVLLNDRHYMKDHGNGRWANLIVFVAIVLAGILALCVIPLQIFGGSDS